MTFKICGRRGGKSYEVNRLAANNPRACVIVPTTTIARVMVHEFPALENRVFSLEEVRGRKLRGAYDTVYVDNLDLMLHELFGLSGRESFGLITATGALDLAPNPFVGSCE